MEPRTISHVVTIFSSIACALVALSCLLRRVPDASQSLWLPGPNNASKRATEIWFLAYSVVWIGAFAGIVGTKAYESFDKMHYAIVCGGLALPYLLQPLVAPGITQDAGKPLLERYSLKANVWVFIFGFIGNYWYTHYFYNVLKAEYTMPGWDLNGVPIGMFFGTHFYFCFYHVLSNCVIRKISTTYEASWTRTLFTTSVILAMSYTTAFMETLTISAFPCWQFKDTHMVYTIGSAFYAIYFIVSFPMFYRVDEDPKGQPPLTLSPSPALLNPPQLSLTFTNLL